MASTKPESPYGLIGSGLVVAMVGGFFLGLAAASSGTASAVFAVGAYVAFVIATVCTGVGVIAAGVRLGMRWARYESR